MIFRSNHCTLRENLCIFALDFAKIEDKYIIYNNIMSLKIVVLAKQVPDTRNVGPDAMTPEGTVNRSALPAIFNPEDLNALEQALRLKDANPGSTVTIVTMGPGRAAEIIREAMYRGADGGYLLTDRAFAGADTLATSYAISTAIKYIGDDVDLIIGGRQAIDGDTAQVGPQIAEKLGLPQVSYVEEFEIADNLKDITVKRQLEDGYELIKLQAPCLLTAIKELNEPRYMSMAGIFGEKKITIWNAKDIEVDLNKVGLLASPTNVFRSFTPAPKAPGMKIEGDTENEQAKNLLINLKGKHII